MSRDDINRVARKAGGVTALVVFIAGANWASTQMTHREDGVDHRAFVTQSQRLIDSVRTASDIRDTAGKLSEVLSKLTDINARLLEVCLAVRSGCR